MDDWTYSYTEVDPPDSKQTRLEQDTRVIEDLHVRAGQAEARAAELRQTQAPDVVSNHAEAAVPFPFATAPCAAPTI